MSEWRRALRSWPEETPETADPASLPEWLQAAPGDEDDATAMREIPVAILLGFFGPIALVFAIGMILQPWLGVWVAAGGLVAGALGGVYGMGAAGNRVSRRRDVRRGVRTLEALQTRGEPTLDGEVAGIAYSDRLWDYPGRSGYDIDHGVVRLDFDRLCFVGRETRFELPAYAILSTEVRRHRWAGDERVRLYVRWREGEKSRTFSLNLPGGSQRRHVQETAALRERIERWRAERFPQRVLPATLPPSVEPQKVMSLLKPIGLRAKLLAAPATILLLGLIEAAATGVAIAMGWPRTGKLLMWLVILSYPVWTVLAAWIERRLPERWRYYDPEAVVPSVDLGDGRSVEETTVRQTV